MAAERGASENTRQAYERDIAILPVAEAAWAWR